MNKDNAIEVRNMTKYFKIENGSSHTLKDFILTAAGRQKPERHVVLEDINLDIKKGETVALIGTNGSGKSTLLKLMTKIYYPSAGTIDHQGKLTCLLELGAGFHIEFTGRENIYFNASIFGLSRKEIEKRVDQIIEFSELEEFIDQPVRTYSSGMFMRLAFAVAINIDADIILVDEILAVGDQHFQDKCYNKLRELKAAGKTIVIVTHDLDKVRLLCDKAIWIYKGSFRRQGEPNSVIEEYLKQIEIDQAKKAEEALKNGNMKEEGIVFIDKPDGMTILSRSTKSYTMNGWIVQNSPTVSLNITIDGQEVVGIVRHRRDDVYNAYAESYGGLMDERILGWKKDLDVSKLSGGLHKLVVQAISSKGKVLSNCECIFKVKEDEDE